MKNRRAEAVGNSCRVIASPCNLKSRYGGHVAIPRIPVLLTVKLMMYQTLPQELQFIGPVADRFGLDPVWMSGGSTSTDHFGPDDIALLAQAYERLLPASHRKVLSRWVFEQPEYKMVPMPDSAPRRVFNLVGVFEALAHRGLAPFVLRPVLWEEVASITPDWSQLPKHLRFLGDFAERYGKSLEETEMRKRAATLTSAELEELVRLADRVRLSGLWRDIYGWMQEHPVGEVEESARLYAMFGLMDLLDLDIGTGKGKGVR